MGYPASPQGIRDCFRIIEYAASFFASFPGLNHDSRTYLDKISKVMDTAGIGLSIPRTITDMFNLNNSIRQYRRIRSTVFRDSMQRKVSIHAQKKIFLSGLSLTNTLSQASLFIHQVDLISLGKYIPLADGIYNVTSIVSDGIELVEESFKLQQYNSTIGGVQTAFLREKKTLSYMKIIKATSSIAGSVLAIVAIFFVAFQMPFVATIILVFDIAWLTMKITGNLYEKILNEKHASPKTINYRGNCKTRFASQIR